MQSRKLAETNTMQWWCQTRSDTTASLSTHLVHVGKDVVVSHRAAGSTYKAGIHIGVRIGVRISLTRCWHRVRISMRLRWG